MRGNRKRDTGPELALRSALHGLGLRFRVDYSLRLDGRRPVRIDVAFTRSRVAIFVDGCFWHRCPQHCKVPTSNRSYWETKLARNAVRDREVDQALALARWRVIRIWEHEEPLVAAGQVAELIGQVSAPG